MFHPERPATATQAAVTVVPQVVTKHGERQKFPHLSPIKSGEIQHLERDPLPLCLHAPELMRLRPLEMKQVLAKP